MNPTPPTIDAPERREALERVRLAMEDPYDGGIWEGGFYNTSPFVTIRLADAQELIADRDLIRKMKANEPYSGEVHWPQKAGDALPEGCPACGALPCDWTNEPKEALLAASSGERGAVLEEAARVADEMRLKFGSPTGDEYTCGTWDQGVRIAQKIRALATPATVEEPKV